MPKKLEELKNRRLEKLKKIKQKGTNPYPNQSERTHNLEEVIRDFNKLQGKRLTLSGRLMLIRGHGKATFAHLENESEKMQIFLRYDDLGKEKYEFFSNFDLGDFIEVTGKLFKTKTQEKTLRVEDFRMLAKALRPLPEKWHGIKDIELKYRKRYLDLMMNHQVKEVFRKRARIVKLIRDFMDKKGFLEVDTPVLQPVYGGAAANPFVTNLDALHMKVYLRIANELYLKRLIIGGFEKVYEFSKDFRNEGIDRTHNPEFTQVEFYWAYSDYNDIMTFVENLYSHLAKEVCGSLKIKYQGKIVDFTPPFKRLKFVEVLEKYSGIKGILEMSKKDLANKVKSLKSAVGGKEIQEKKHSTKAEILEDLFDYFVQDKLWNPTFIIDWPKETTPLAKVHRDDPRLVERFEPSICGMEIGNGFTELNDPIDQRRRFEEQVEARKKGAEETHPLDCDFLEAIEYGMPPTGGMGVPIDRLTMILTDSPTIKDVVLFPFMKQK